MALIPAPIWSMARVMMKEGMPIFVMPKAVTAPRRRQLASASTMASAPGSGRLAMLTLASWSVKKATTMPVALAMAATLRSISAHRMTKVRPTAIIAVTETCVRILARLPSVAKDGLAALKNTTRKSSVRNGAMLRSWPRSQRARPPVAAGARSAACPVIRSRASGGGKEAILADRLAGELAHDRALLHDDDAVGEGEHGLGLGRDDDDADALIAQPAHDLDHVVLGADIHAARRLAQHAHLRRIGQPVGQPDLLLVAARQRAQQPLRRGRADMQPADMLVGDAPLERRLEQQARQPAEDADRDVLIDRLVGEQHEPAAFRHEGDAGAPRRGGAAQQQRTTPDAQRAAIGAELAEEGARELELAASHEAVYAEHLALPHGQGDVAIGAPAAEPRGFEHDRRLRPAVEQQFAGIAFLELVMAGADRALDDPAFIGPGGGNARPLPAGAQDGDRIRDAPDLSEEMRMETDALAGIS